jgi:hypothetical protein
MRLGLLLGLLVAVPARADDPPANSRWNWYTFGSGIALNVRTGEVRLPPGMRPDRASRLFWNDVAGMRGTARPFPMEKMP